jgi:quercetin dioxygenase-like cupin family protein
MTDPLAARLGRATLGNSAWYRDRLITFLAIGEDTDGHYSLLRVRGAKEAEESPHYHTQEAETIYLLEGGLTVLAGEEEFCLGPGEVVTIPRGLRHAIRHVGGEVAFLLQYSPAGFERYFHELSDAAQYLGLPPNPAELDPARLRETAARYGCVVTEILPQTRSVETKWSVPVQQR